MNELLYWIIRTTDDLSNNFGSGDATLDIILVAGLIGILLAIFETETTDNQSSQSTPYENQELDLNPNEQLVKEQPLTIEDTAEEFLVAKKSLSKSRGQLVGKLKDIFSKNKTGLNQEIFSELEIALISSDLGVQTASKLINAVKVKSNGTKLSFETLKELLILEIESTLNLPNDKLKNFESKDTNPKVIMVVGVNGAGKTTTIGKLASKFKNEGRSVILVAGDTFRAAATEQLEIWGQRVGVKVAKGKEGSKPTGVIFDGLKLALDEQAEIVLVDTAGRLHSKSNLMQELSGVKNSMQKLVENAPHEVWLVLDGTSGQNGFLQAKTFNESVELTGVIVTKLDSTSKGGVVVSVVSELGVPVKYLGLGEGEKDLVPFNSQAFAKALLDE